MAIASYTDLQAAVSANMARGDTLVADNFAAWVELAENVFNYGTDNIEALRTTDMETVSSAFVPVMGTVSLPIDFLGYISVYDLSTTGGRVLKYITPDAAQIQYPNGQAGVASYFTIIGNSLSTYPATTSNVKTLYYARIPPLTSTNTSNWLLLKSPQTYLRGVLAQAYEHVKDDAETAKQVQMMASLVVGLNKSSMLSKFSRANHQSQRYTP